MKIKRYLQSCIQKDLNKKMVFVYGPRQVGKTTLSLSFLKKGSEKHPAYFNWDYLKDRQRFLKLELPAHQKILIFDEIHKYKHWRNHLKGIYDKNKSDRKILVTGSGAFQNYNRGGDSLQGRYFSYRLHPFSLMELNKNPNSKDLNALLEFSGFPEPFLTGSKVFLNRWKKSRLELLVRTDIRDLEKIKELSLMELLVDLLPSKVGSPLSVKNIKEDLQVSHATVERWICILESLFFCFRIPPFGSPKIRAVKKEQKLYMFDWSQIENKSFKFENLVACQLLKYCHYQEDYKGLKTELRFLRDTDKREVDFIVLQNKKPLFAVECKTGEKQVSNSVKYFKERLNIPKFYQVHLKNKDYESNKVRVLPFTKFCKELKMP
ncbi:MAG: ATP-binding protein [Bdellovibrionales bacterium]